MAEENGSTETGVTVFVRNLPVGVTNKQLEGRFGKLGYVVKRASVTSKNGINFGHVTFAVNSVSGHGDQYQIQKEVLDKCTRTFNYTMWQGSKIFVEEGREHFSEKIRRERELHDTERKQSEAHRRAEMVANTTPLFEGDDALRIKRRSGERRILVKGDGPASWDTRPSRFPGKPGKRSYCRKYVYNSDDSDDVPPVCTWSASEEEEMIDLPTTAEGREGDASLEQKDTEMEAPGRDEGSDGANTREERSSSGSSESSEQSGEDMYSDEEAVAMTPVSHAVPSFAEKRRTSIALETPASTEKAAADMYSEEEWGSEEDGDGKIDSSSISNGETDGSSSEGSEDEGDEKKGGRDQPIRTESRTAATIVAEREPENERPRSNSFNHRALFGQPAASQEMGAAHHVIAEETTSSNDQGEHGGGPDTADPAEYSEEDWDSDGPNDQEPSGNGASESGLPRPSKPNEKAQRGSSSGSSSRESDDSGIDSGSSSDAEDDTRNVHVESAKRKRSVEESSTDLSTDLNKKQRKVEVFNHRNLFNPRPCCIEDDDADADGMLKPQEPDIRKNPAPAPSADQKYPGYMYSGKAENAEDSAAQKAVEVNAEQLRNERQSALALFDSMMGDEPGPAHEDGLRLDKGNGSGMHQTLTRHLPLGRQGNGLEFNKRYNPLLDNAAEFELEPKEKVGELGTSDGTSKSEQEDPETEKNKGAGAPSEDETANGEENQKEEAKNDEDRFFWKSKTNYWTSMFNEAATKEDTNISTAAASTFSLSSLFSLPTAGTDAAAAPSFALKEPSTAIPEEDATDPAEAFLHPFMRSKTLEEITEEWKAARHDLTLSFKRKYKSAMKMARRGGGGGKKR